MRDTCGAQLFQSSFSRCDCTSIWLLPEVVRPRSHQVSSCPGTSSGSLGASAEERLRTFYLKCPVEATGPTQRQPCSLSPSLLPERARRHLSQKPKPAAAALRAARRELLRSQGGLGDSGLRDSGMDEECSLLCVCCNGLGGMVARQGVHITRSGFYRLLISLHTET